MSDVVFTGMAAKAPGLDFIEHSYTPHTMEDYDVDVAIHFCGICHSDIHAVTGDWGPRPYPLIPGHEIVGKIIRVGAKVTKHKVGDDVGVGPQVLSCQGCYTCDDKQEQYCQKSVFLYSDGTYPDSNVPVHGGYANGIRVHEEFAIPFPKELDMEVAAPLLCAGATTYKPLKDHGAGPGKKVGILGIGGLGHLAILFAVAMGADVYALSRSNKKKDEAMKLGAKDLLATNKKENFSSHNNSFDLIIMTASAELDFPKYFDLLKSNATFVFIGAMGKLNIPTSYFLFRAINVTGSLIGSPSETAEMLAFAAKNKINPWSTTFPLSEADSVVKAVNEGKAHYRYVLKVEDRLD